MHSTLTTLIRRLDSADTASMDIIRWGCPVPAFGDLSASRVATLGLNPSRREFMDPSGDELKEGCRRFQTLNSLGISSWSDVDFRHLRIIIESCRSYFTRNPYDAWFGRLDRVVSCMNTSYYDASSSACHLDLVPFATVSKWIDLTASQRLSLFSLAADTLGNLLRDSPVRVLILNGRSVVDNFQEFAGVTLRSYKMPTWSLRRRSGRPVEGFAFRGFVQSVFGLDFDRELLVLGFNHNLQSSYGVTSHLIREIGRWVSRAAREVLS